MQPLKATIPTQYGDINVSMENNLLRVTVPEGATGKFRGKSYTATTPLEVQL